MDTAPQRGWVQSPGIRAIIVWQSPGHPMLLPGGVGGGRFVSREFVGKWRGRMKVGPQIVASGSNNRYVTNGRRIIKERTNLLPSSTNFGHVVTYSLDVLSSLKIQDIERLHNFDTINLKIRSWRRRYVNHVTIFNVWIIWNMVGGG